MGSDAVSSTRLGDRLLLPRQRHQVVGKGNVDLVDPHLNRGVLIHKVLTRKSKQTKTLVAGLFLCVCRMRGTPRRS